MNNAMHFFAPELEQLYTQQLTPSSISLNTEHIDVPNLFYQLNQAGNNYAVMPEAYHFIKQAIMQAQPLYASAKWSAYSADQLATVQAIKIPPLAQQFNTQDNLTTWIRQTTPVLLTQPCWLQNISPSAASQSITSIQLMSLYLQLSGENQRGVSAPQSYRAMLLNRGITIPCLHSHNVSQQLELLPALLNFATLQRALSLFPRVLLPEILGFTLAYCHMPTLIETCFAKPELPGMYLQQCQQQQLAPLTDCINAYMSLFGPQKKNLWLRIQQGFWLYQHQMQCSSKQFNETLAKASTFQKITSLLQQKSTAAIGHHQKIQLQGQTLDQWFANIPENTAEFLQALIQSDYVDRKNPEASRLLKLFALNGPMFGILDKPELDLLMQWLKGALTTDPDIEPHLETITLATHKKSAVPQQNSPQSYHKPTLSYAKLNNRALYYYLLNVDLFPAVLLEVKHKVSKLLRNCALLNPPPFKHYSHQQFSAYIENIYQQEMNAYQPLKKQPKISKEAYLWGIKQIAPMILIDGCWLQNCPALKVAHPEIYAMLLKIYCDEIGNGQREHNHPYIFQQLLDSLSIQVPPTYSKAFTEHPGFIDSAFDLPVYMLSIANFSVEFLPELLGLNMAIELSGLGKNYMNLVDDWNYWGIDPTIASIHISIDNYANGHTFLAKKAIQLYLDNLMLNSNNRTLLNNHWRRIYTGYASLRFVGTRFKLALPISYLSNKYMRNFALLVR